MNFLHGYSTSCSPFFQAFAPILHFALRKPTELFSQVLIRVTFRCRDLPHGSNMVFYSQLPPTTRRSFFACATMHRVDKETTWPWMISHFDPVVQRSRRTYKTVLPIRLMFVKAI